jgi:hypothetical protein
MQTARRLLVVVAIIFWTGAALGQDTRGHHRRHHGGDRPSASSSARRADPETAAFLRRVDTNHNGMIDEDEINQLGEFLKKTVEQKLTKLGIELKYPISLGNIVASTKGEGGHESGGDGSASQDDTASNESSSAPHAKGFEPPKSSLPAVPGFGQPSEQASGGEDKSRAASTHVSASSSHSTSARKEGGDSPATASAASDSSTDSPKRTGPKSGRFLTPHERLPSGLPDWFREKDVNGDGQVDMSEYASEWTPALVEEFNRYDLNHDGVITAAECLKAESPHHKGKHAAAKE